jgi:hypothetical protein
MTRGTPYVPSSKKSTAAILARSKFMMGYLIKAAWPFMTVSIPGNGILYIQISPIAMLLPIRAAVRLRDDGYEDCRMIMGPEGIS